MPKGYYRDVVKLLRGAGSEYIRNAKGSHEIWSREGDDFDLVVPRGLYNRHTANAILKRAGIAKKL